MMRSVYECSNFDMVDEQGRMGTGGTHGKRMVGICFREINGTVKI